MELTGAIIALEKLTKKSKVKLHTDSQYTINGIEK
jgi:ribonuclease HI